MQGSFKPSILVGPAIAIKLSGKRNLDFSLGSENFSSEEDLEELKRTDIGFVFGAAGLLNEMIMIDIRYVLGLTSGLDDFGELNDVNNQVISITVGYLF